MGAFNVITGLPRTGSTLLCNILNQNPEFYASSTSPLPGMVASLSSLWSHSPEVSSMLINNRDKTNARMERTLRAVIEGWYPGMKKGYTTFDKSRGWAIHSLLLQKLYPESLSIVLVRDLRSIMGSIEKQHHKNPVLDQAQHPLGKTLFNRADQMLGPDGVVGAPLVGVEDIIRRQPENCMIIRYEDLAQGPTSTLDRVYECLGLEPFEHNFDNVENVSEDVDDLYLGKFEHKGEGFVDLVDPNEWKEYVSQDIADLIMERFQFYNDALGYS